MATPLRTHAARHEASISGFRDAHRDETIIVCGCGPSLNDFTSPERFVTIGVNDVGRLFDPTYLVVVNPRSQFKGDRFQFVEQSNASALFTHLELGPVHPPVVRFRLGAYAGTEPTPDGVLHYSQNSPYVAVCLAAYMGAKRIGLIGVDLTDDHFFAKTGRHALSGRLREIDTQYGRLAASLQRRGIELVNMSAVSRLTSLPKRDVALLAPVADAQPNSLRIVSYSTTPVAGVPGILARCIASQTPHASRCVWATRSYGNGVVFDGDLEWNERPLEAERAIAEADVIIAHNGKVDAKHARLLSTKPVITLAHNYMWNVDRRFERLGMPALVVGQYQATLPEFAGWTTMPNPVPIGEPAYMPGEKPNVVTICYVPSGRHERYPPGHRLYWHGKGYATTMRVLEQIAATMPVRLEVIRDAQVSHATVLAMKRRSHIVIDECVTGSYHRSSLEGLATGCVVVNGVGLLPGVEDALRRCAPDAAALPFVFSNLDTLDAVLRQLVAQGPESLAIQGATNRAWMERHWNFAGQWERIWTPVIDAARRPSPLTLKPMPVATRVRSIHREPPAPVSATALVSVVVSHGGSDRLSLLAASLASLRQAQGVGEVIVVEMGERPCAVATAERWADKHLFVEHSGPFERARALNAGAAIADCDYVLWHDNDLLVPSSFIARSVAELRDRRLDYLIPYTSISYLSADDSRAVMQGERAPHDCRPVNTLYSRRAPSCSGGLGLVTREFLRRHGGLVEGFRGWGGEDNAWNRKIMLLGRASPTTRQDQHVHHLHHPTSGGYAVGGAGINNPHYPENLALLSRVWSMTSATHLTREFPAAPPATGTLTRSNGRVREPARDGLPIWTYWEGPCPAWIRACRQTITKYAPRVRLLTPQSFDQLRDRDRDVDLSRLHIPHRADFVRAFLLHRYGGLWIDADCLVMHSLQPVIDLLGEHDFVGHRERAGIISNGFIAARHGSRVASVFYERVRETVRSRRPLHWNAIGADPLSKVIAEDASGWHELPVERVQPVCWSAPGDFFEERDDAEHERVFDPLAFCYMLSNGAINNYSRAHQHPDLLAPRTFFSWLLRRSLGQAANPSGAYEEIFSGHAELYRRDRIESTSGPGSSLAQTKEVRARLPLLVESLGIRSLLDAPCGDFNWMQHVQLPHTEYVGMDVLGEAIVENQWRHSNEHRRFLRADLIREPLPRADAVLCRDLLPHLSYEDVYQALRNFRASGATWLITTTFTGPRPNHDIASGGWRTLNFTLAPFNFPAPLRVINEKCTEGGNAFADKSLGVWRLAELPL